MFAPSTLDRLKSVLPRLAQTWSGTMSVAVLASEEDVRRDFRYEYSRVHEKSSDRHRGGPRCQESRNEIPGQRVANLALSGCKRTLNATYVVLHDVDFEIFSERAIKRATRRN